MNQKIKLLIAIVGAIFFFTNLVFIANNIPLTPELSGPVALIAVISAIITTLATRSLVSVYFVENKKS